MAKSLYPFDATELDKLVNRFFKEQNINPDYVTEYRLSRPSHPFTTISIDMIFELKEESK